MGEERKFVYPAARRDDSIKDDFDGTEICDPYRWMEDPDGEETKEFVKAQQAVTTPFLESLDSRDEVREKVTAYYNYEKVGCPFRKGDRYYFYRNSGLQNQSVLYYRTSLDGEAQVFVDPNEWSDDGTTSISSTAFSKDASLVLFSISEKGSDWKTVKFRRVSDNDFMEDKLEWIKFSSFAWTHDNKGVFYASFDKPAEIEAGADKGTEGASNKNQKLYYHVLGTPQSEDKLIYEAPEFPNRMWGAEVSDDGNYLIISVRESCEPKNLVYYANLSSFDGSGSSLDIKELVSEFEDEYNYITNEGTLFYFQTKEEFICIDLESPDKDSWKTLIPKGEDILESVCCFHQNILVTTFIHDVQHVMKLYELATGKFISDVNLPTIGTVSSISGEKEFSELFYKFTSFTYPGTIFSYDLAKKESSVFYETNVKGFKPESFTVEQVFYESKDSTKIPMFLFYPKDVKRDGNAVTYLYGYGGFDISLMPSFSSLRCAFAEGFNAVVAIANLRGGGEYGPKWHKAGVKEKKQNVFDDFIAAAEFLITNKYTCAKRIVTVGGSNGGLLVAACMNQRPDLFGAVICHVGVLDMLRFHKFTIGHYWVSDYGCADEEEDFKYLIKYSPLHTIKADGREFPSTLLCTADHDDRVVPAHSLKYIAELQHAVGSQDYQHNPLFIRVESNAGHGGGKPTSKIISEYVDVYCFIGYALNAKWLS
uniref:Prolyl endopeptidase n=1 Tax=Vannella robusta TaxID=1487602 RepID=A0A7S4HME6_9EUKA|mmetsp:Transcript_12868/g.16061  ORF Transcript_12868/g.16061 Transcript_12868/m.16061 type:complete len:707 (+) Transcript_12868:15-2135(+)